MELPEDFRARYMERRKRDLETCRQCLEKSNFMEIEKVGHQLKGNGVTFGYSELSVIGKRLEGAAASKDIQELKQLLKDLTLWVNKHLN